MRKLLLKILPEGIIEIYKNRRRNARLKQRQLIEKSEQTVTQENIEEALQKAGIKAGDIVMVHCSLSKIGLVQNGAQALINAALNTAGKEGTVMMPSFPANGYNYDYLKSMPVYDARNTPSKTGIVSETFRKMRGAERSLHPTDPVCAIGKQAHELVKDHFGQLTPYNSKSPFYKLCELKGKIVLIGVDLNSLTNLHTLEDAVNNFEYPVYHKTIFEAMMIDEHREKKIMKTKVHDPVYSKKRQCNALIRPFEQAGFLHRFTIGFAGCMLIEADKMHAWMVENYISKGITMYTPNGK